MKKLIMILLISLILISGCALIEKLPGLSQSGKITDLTMFVKGSDGIIIEMLNPIDGGKVYPDTEKEFRIRARLINKGASEAEGAMCAFGLPEETFPGFSKCSCQSFENFLGRQVIKGTETEAKEEVLELESSEIKKGGITDFTLTTSTKYDYITYGTVKACIKKDKSSGGCKLDPNLNILKAVSAAPIQITKVTQELKTTSEQDSTLYLTIEIQNTGDGHLYDKDATKEDCELKKDLEKKIEVVLANEPGTGQCSQVELEDKKGETHCSIKGVKLRNYDYEPDIMIKLLYTYETINSIKFEVA